jgi:hypothetical protein
MITNTLVCCCDIYVMTQTASKMTRHNEDRQDISLDPDTKRPASPLQTSFSSATATQNYLSVRIARMWRGNYTVAFGTRNLSILHLSRSQLPSGLGHELFSPAPTLRSWVRIPLRHGCSCVFFLLLHSLK